MSKATGEWKRARELFDRAIDVPRHSRDAFVKEQAGADESLYGAVRSLLEQHNSRDPKSDAGLGAFLESMEDGSADARIGARLGPYTLTRRIGRGGMGAVYEALRDDDQYRQRVAIKLIRPGMDSEAIVRRFRRERQILATLEHPNIARLLDGGMTDDERPFLVMEFVDGQAIDAYSDEKLLSVRQRIALFIEVCTAVDYAHRNLVVHRDLKPGNILVTTEGVPKLLDFGVAKLLHDIEQETPASATTIDGRFLTPEYASPEQIRDEPVTTVSDVYSLGLILYELLAGHHPMREAARSRTGYDRLLSTDPAKPSAVITADAASRRSEQSLPRLRRRLAGELDNIVLKAIRKEPERRYASVHSLADDLRRHLDGKPVLAQKDTVAYRTRKFVSLHKAGVAAVLVVMASLAGGMSVALVQAQRAQTALVHAEAEQRKSEQVVSFLENMIGAGNRTWTSLKTRPNATTTVLDALNQISASVDVELKGSPDAEATIRRTMGNTYQMLGLPDSADRHLRKAVAIRRQISPAPNLDLARDLMGLAAARTYAGDYREALALMREGLAVHNRIGDTTSIHYATLLNDFSVLLARNGDFKAGEQYAAKAVAMFRRKNTNSTDLATALGNIAFFRFATGDVSGSAAFGEEAAAIYNRPEFHNLSERGTAIFNMAMVRKWQGRYAEADSQFAAAGAVFKATVPHHQYGMLVSIERAYTFLLWGKLDSAEQALNAARTFATETNIPDAHPEFGRFKTVQGLILIARGSPARAEPILRTALATRSAAHGPSDYRTMETAGALGLALSRLGRADEARPLLDKAHIALLQKFGESDPRTALVGGWRRELEANARL